MKARNIEVGAVIDGWTVTAARPADIRVGSVGAIQCTHMLLALERQESGIRMVYTEHGVTQVKLPPETRRTWFQADEEATP